MEGGGCVLEVAFEAHHGGGRGAADDGGEGLNGGDGDGHVAGSSEGFVEFSDDGVVELMAVGGGDGIAWEREKEKWETERGSGEVDVFDWWMEQANDVRVCVCV